ncbi:MAG: hypothetical protein WBE26_18110 [Phycisphaerae bacterium]
MTATPEDQTKTVPGKKANEGTRERRGGGNCVGESKTMSASLEI